MSDFASINSLKSAQAGARQGLLARVFLLPAELGGSDVPENIVYVPVESKNIKDQFTRELLDLYRSGSINKVSVVPSYKGDSFVPSQILVSAWLDEKPLHYERVINIW